jgi:hypothetical protein
VPSKRTLPRDRSWRLLAFLTWLLASLATAALAHVLIDAFGAIGAGGDAYDEHAHASVAPVTLGAIALIATLLLRSATLRVGRAQAIDPALILATRFGSMPLLVPVLVVTLGGFGTLLGMEFTEQVSAFGHIEGVADALGGNAAVGFAIIGCVALALTFAGLRSAKALLDVAASGARALYAWIVVSRRTRVDAALLRRGHTRSRHRTSGAFRKFYGLRAPPIAG